MAPVGYSVKFLACYVHLVGEGTEGMLAWGAGGGRANPGLLVSKTAWVGLCSGMGVPGWAPLAKSTGRLLAHHREL